MQLSLTLSRGSIYCTTLYCETCDSYVRSNKTWLCYWLWQIVSLTDPPEELQMATLSTHCSFLTARSRLACHCIGKKKLMSILKSSLPDQRPDQEEDGRQHAGKRIVNIDGMAVIQSMEKPTWVCNGRDLTIHFLETIDNRSKECDEIHTAFDRYVIPNSLKQGILQFRQGCNRPMVYNEHFVVGTGFSPIL